MINFTKNILFNDPSEFVFDNNKIEISNNKGKLKLNGISLPFDRDYNNDDGFIYDSDKVEFVGGKCQQKNQRPGSGATFGANYNNNIDGNWGNGILIGTAFGEATISGGKLNLAHNDVRYVDYDADLNADSQQIGTIRFKLTPNWSGNPSTAQVFFSITKAHNDTTNQLYIYQDNIGQIWLFIHGNTGVNNAIFGVWNPIAGQEYEFELNYDITIGKQRLFINGVQFGATKTIVTTRTADIGLLRVGSMANGVPTANFKIDDFVIFSTVQHIVNYTLGYIIEDYDYLGSSVILSEREYTGDGYILSADSFVTIESGIPRYIIQIERSGNYLYWNGSIWAISNGTYAQANDVVTFNDNMSSIDALNKKYAQLKIIFEDSNTHSYIDNSIFTVTAEFYSKDNPTIEVNAILDMKSLSDFIDSIIEVNSDKIKYILKKDDKWYWYGGLKWIESNGDYTQSNTAIEIKTNKSSFTDKNNNVKIKIFLHSNDGITTPEINSLIVKYAGNILKCKVLLNILDITSNISKNNNVKVKMNKQHVWYDNEIILNDQQIFESDSNGIVTMELIGTELFGSDVHYIFDIGGVLKEKKKVPKDIIEINYKDLPIV